MNPSPNVSPLLKTFTVNMVFQLGSLCSQMTKAAHSHSSSAETALFYSGARSCWMTERKRWWPRRRSHPLVYSLPPTQRPGNLLPAAWHCHGNELLPGNKRSCVYNSSGMFSVSAARHAHHLQNGVGVHHLQNGVGVVMAVHCFLCAKWMLGI